MRFETKRTTIPKAVKERVAERDSIEDWPCCIWCGFPAPSRLAYSNAHYIGRAQGGLGIEENILTLCPECHRKYDQSPEREKMRNAFRIYLKERYPGWDEERLTYRKGGRNG